MRFCSKLPDFSGPYEVGTIDVELPVSELNSPTSPPTFEKGFEIRTIQYRLFFPCEPDTTKAKSLGWLPQPQRAYASSYAKFLGIGGTLADFVSYLPTPLQCIEIPVRKDATLAIASTPNKRWPLMIFSHGLGGTRNAYSCLAGSLASHGMIVVTPEHRDGSAPVSYISKVSPKAIKGKKADEKLIIDYLRLPHTPSPEVEACRNSQLKIRLWELGLIHESLLKVDRGEAVTNLNFSASSLDSFIAMMDVHTPGKIVFGGHSFGAATMTQFVKSTFYSIYNSKAPSDYKPLFKPSSNSSIVKQITPQTPVVLLDVWCLPLGAKSMSWLWNQPFPCYHETQGSPGGAVLLGIESEAFYKWSDHFRTTRDLLTPDPSASTHRYDGSDGTRWSEPNFYYVTKSAHISQSDFGLMFPWLTKKMAGSEEPERIIKLNVRAILQLLRNQKYHLSATSAVDRELDAKSSKNVSGEDQIILSRESQVRGWNWISTTEDHIGKGEDRETTVGQLNKPNVEAVALEKFLEK